VLHTNQQPPTVPRARHSQTPDFMEFIWSLAGQDMTQAEIADILKWSRTSVANYQALGCISPDAWQVAIVTTKTVPVTNGDEGVVTPNVTTVAFTDGLADRVMVAAGDPG
jgi:hypothetical protein